MKQHTHRVAKYGLRLKRRRDEGRAGNLCSNKKSKNDVFQGSQRHEHSFCIRRERAKDIQRKRGRFPSTDIWSHIQVAML